jgi:hypothetical protein
MIRAGWRQSRFYRVVTNEFLIVRLIRIHVGGQVSNVSLSPFVELLADGLPQGFINNVDDALKDGIDWPVVRELQRRRVVRELPQVRPLPKDAIRPGRNPRLFPGTC